MHSTQFPLCESTLIHNLTHVSLCLLQGTHCLQLKFSTSEYSLVSIEHKLGLGSSLIFSLLLWWLNSCFWILISATQFTCLPRVSCFEAKNRWMCGLWYGPVLDSEVHSGERTNIDPQPMTFGFSLFVVYSRCPSLTSLAIKLTFVVNHGVVLANFNHASISLRLISCAPYNDH